MPTRHAGVFSRCGVMSSVISSRRWWPAEPLWLHRNTVRDHSSTADVHPLPALGTQLPAPQPPRRVRFHLLNTPERAASGRFFSSTSNNCADAACASGDTSDEALQLLCGQMFRSGLADPRLAADPLCGVLSNATAAVAQSLAERQDGAHSARSPEASAVPLPSRLSVGSRGLEAASDADKPSLGGVCALSATCFCFGAGSGCCKDACTSFPTITNGDRRCFATYQRWSESDICPSTGGQPQQPLLKPAPLLLAQGGGTHKQRPVRKQKFMMVKRSADGHFTLVAASSESPLPPLQSAEQQTAPVSAAVDPGSAASQPANAAPALPSAGQQLDTVGAATASQTAPRLCPQQQQGGWEPAEHCHSVQVADRSDHAAESPPAEAPATPTAATAPRPSTPPRDATSIGASSSDAVPIRGAGIGSDAPRTPSPAPETDPLLNAPPSAQSASRPAAQPTTAQPEEARKRSCGDGAGVLLSGDLGQRAAGELEVVAVGELAHPAPAAPRSLQRMVLGGGAGGASAYDPDSEDDYRRGCKPITQMCMTRFVEVIMLAQHVTHDFSTHSSAGTNCCLNCLNCLCH